MSNRKGIQLLALVAVIMGILLGLNPWIASLFQQPTPTLVSVVPTYTPTPTYTPMPTSTDTPTPTPTGVLSPTNTPTPTPTATSAATSTTTGTPTSTATSTPTQTSVLPTTATDAPRPTATPTPTATPPSTGRIALIYLRDTLTETVLEPSGDQVNGGMIYEEGRFVYGDAAVQIGETTYHFDKPLPDPWRVEFEFDQLLVARTGNQAGFNPQKAQFWVGTLDGDSAVGEDRPYSLTMKLYEGSELRESIQVFFTVKDAPKSGGGGGGPAATPYPTPPE